MMSPLDRLQGSRLARRRRKGGSTTGMESVTTAELALPGLEKGTLTEPSQGHWIERGPQKPLEPISARLVADMLQLAGADRVLTMDLHAGQIQGFFTIPVDHMTALPLFARHFRDLGLTGRGNVSVAPDEGHAKMAVRFAEMIDAEFAIMHKTRPAHDEVAVTEVTGRVKGKTAIVGDDVIMTGGKLIANVNALREHGVEGVHVFATHGVFCGGALQKFHDAPIDGIVVTDTVPINPLEMPKNMTVLPVAGLLAETITNVFGDDSVSAIFGGENQLF